MRTIVGFTGPIGSGKTTAANYLFHRGYMRIRFAGPLKAMLRQIGLSEDHTDGKLKEEPCDILLGKTPRWAMQTLGTEWGRECIGEDFWINVFKHAVLRQPEKIPIVCDDIRFINEAAMIESMGGAVYYVDRPRTWKADHSSEQFNWLPPNVIRNHGSVRELEDFLEILFFPKGA